jgi:hypothetical protein
VTIPVAVLVGLGVVIAAALSLIGILLGHQAARIDALERRQDRSDAYLRRLWLWARRTVDLYYRHRVEGAPDPDPIPTEDGLG